MAKFFEPGALKLTNFLTTEWGGSVPSLFKIQWYEDKNNNWAATFTGNYSPVTEPISARSAETGESNVAGTENTAPYGLYSFELNTAYLKQLFPKGFNQFGEKALLYKVFPTIPLWPTRPMYFIGTNASARNLFYYYHWR
jgi:hypothetical protein